MVSKTEYNIFWPNLSHHWLHRPQFFVFFSTCAFAGSFFCLLDQHIKQIVVAESFSETVIIPFVLNRLGSIHLLWPIGGQGTVMIFNLNEVVTNNVFLPYLKLDKESQENENHQRCFHICFFFQLDLENEVSLPLTVSANWFGKRGVSLWCGWYCDT